MGEKINGIQKTKVEAVNALKEEFSSVNDFFFTDYRGMTVEQITELRSKLRAEDASYKVVKNRFAKIALKELDQPVVDDKLVGPTAVVMTRGESGPAAKIMVEAAKDMPLEIKGGIINGDVYTAQELEAFSKLPTRDELIAMLMGTMKAPVRDLVYVLNEIPTQLVRTLKAVADKKNEA